ncbi:site-specific recombinase [Sinimarinibacterium flocculans]|uniref:site-specific recombinase n=1 Tax=Sinimarinibacterium flocculans TaxID=985250 RepID=UPI002491DD32|nr:site-specific recombinase [Sinimarinibacterium flocculans]
MLKRWFGAERQAARTRKQLDAAIERLQSADAAQRLPALAALVRWLRPRRLRDTAVARERLQVLVECVRSDAAARAAIRNALLWLVTDTQPLRLLSDSGILSGQGFVGGLWRRFVHGLLPDELDPAQLRDAVNLLFARRDDYVWVEAIADADWVGFLDALDLGAAGREHGRRLPFQILEALQVVSYRIAALGLEPELVRNHPAIERYESPFLTQNVEMRQFIDEHQAAIADKRDPALDDKHLLVLLGQCEQIIGKVRKQAAQTGASVSLTVLLARLNQNIGRLKLLLQLLERRPVHELNELRVRFFKQVVRAENTRHSVSELWQQNVELLATRITDNASKTGEHYVTTTRAEYWGMLRSAAGAGCIVPAMAMIKVALSAESHSPLAGAVLYSLNYGLGFVLIYLLHFTIATKQPAMTASYLASTLSAAQNRKERIAIGADLVVRTLRSQFIAIIGNVLPAFLLPVAIAYAILLNTGRHYLEPETARYLLVEQHPLQSLAWLHAGVAGVCLFLAGLISGYFDNKAVYNRIPQRMLQLRWLRRLLGQARAERFAVYVENNLGALAGNFFFGCMLGSAGTIGFILGLPLDIRHITFSTSYFGYAMVALDWQLARSMVAMVAIGVAGIGVINLLVSFSLALFVALRAQRVPVSDRRELMLEVARRALRRPQDLMWPPRDPVPEEEAKSESADEAAVGKTPAAG